MKRDVMISRNKFLKKIKSKIAYPEAMFSHLLLFRSGKLSEVRVTDGMNPVASAFPVACCGVSERMGNIIIPYGSKILRSLLRRASIGQQSCRLYGRKYNYQFFMDNWKNIIYIKAHSSYWMSCHSLEPYNE
jgi:hypothetical protein